MQLCITSAGKVICVPKSEIIPISGQTIIKGNLEMAALLDGIFLDLSIFGRPTRCYLFISFAPSTSDRNSVRPRHELQLTGCLRSPAVFQHATNQHFTPTLERWNACEKKRKKKSQGLRRGCGVRKQKWGQE